MEVGRYGRGRKVLALGVAAAALTAGSYAYTAANTVPGTRAGDGAATVSGYTVSAVDYRLAADPTLIDSVAFTLDAAASTVKAKLEATGTTYTDCTSVAANDWECDFASDVPVVSADELTVIATG